MRRRYLRDFPLHFEERCAVVRELCNTTIGAKTEEQVRDLMLRLMAIAEGDRNSVPKRFKELARIPYRFARRSK